MASGPLGRLGLALERLLFGPAESLYRRFIRSLGILTTVLLVVYGLVFADLLGVSAGIENLLRTTTAAAVTLFLLAGVVQLVVLARVLTETSAEMAETAEELETAADEIETTADDLETAADEVETAAAEAEAVAEGDDDTPAEPEEVVERAEEVKETAKGAKERTEEAKDTANELKKIVEEKEQRLPSEPTPNDDTEAVDGGDGDAGTQETTEE